MYPTEDWWVGTDPLLGSITLLLTGTAVLGNMTAIYYISTVSITFVENNRYFNYYIQRYSLFNEKSLKNVTINILRVILVFDF